MKINNKRCVYIAEIIENKYKSYLDIFSVYYQKERVIKLVTLKAKKDSPKGTGSQFMIELTHWADQNNVILALEPAHRGDFKSDKSYKQTTSKNRIINFYRRFGFEMVKNNPFGEMIRNQKIKLENS